MLVGLGAIIIPIVIGSEGAIFGVGAVVTKDVSLNAVVSGNSGKVIKYVDPDLKAERNKAIISGCRIGKDVNSD